MATRPAAKKSAAKKSAAKKATAVKAAAKKAPAKKASPNKAAAKKAASPKKTAAPKKAAAKKAASTDKAATAKKVTAKKAPATKVASASTAERSAAKKVVSDAAPKKAPTKAAEKAPAPKKVAAKKSPAKKATSPYDGKFLDEMRKALLEERAKYTHTAELAKADAEALAEMREPGDVQFDDESGEGDTLAVERDFELAMSAQARHTVDEIDHALAKIDAGTYGLCETSDLPIPKERLRALPWARKRVEHQVGSFGNR